MSNNPSIESLKNRVWWTKKARIKAEERLLSSAFHTQMMVFWYSFFSVATSIYYLKYAASSEYSAVSWVIFSVLVLCASSFLNGIDYKSRASLIKECYEKLGALYAKCENTLDSNVLNDEYLNILNACENHLEKDYRMAVCQEYFSTLAGAISAGKKPSYYMLYRYFSDWFERLLLLISFYVLPVIILKFVA